MLRDRRRGYTTYRTLLGLGLLVPLAPGCRNETPTSTTEAAPLHVASPVANMVREATRPMAMTFTVEFVGLVDEPLPECLVGHFRSVLEGRATHLGNFSGVGSTCILTLAPDQDPPFLPPGPPPYATAAFTNPLWVLTAANGDELWLEATDAVAVLGVNPDDGSFTSLAARGTHRIIGGTGRFAGATGELQTMAVNEDAQGPDDAQSEGWIRY